MAGLTCKASVRFKAFTPAMLRILRGVYAVAAPCQDVTNIVITSANDSIHGEHSRHYLNEALDLRVHNFPTAASRSVFVASLRAELGPAFTVLLEGAGTPQHHIHVQPKKGTTYAGPV